MLKIYCLFEWLNSSFISLCSSLRNHVFTNVFFEHVCIGYTNGTLNSIATTVYNCGNVRLERSRHCTNINTTSQNTFCWSCGNENWNFFLLCVCQNNARVKPAAINWNCYYYWMWYHTLVSFQLSNYQSNTNNRDVTIIITICRQVNGVLVIG